MIKGLKEQIEITERKVKQLEDEITPDTHFSLIDKLELEYCKNNLKCLKALATLKQNMKVEIDYGVEHRNISCAIVFYIDNKKTIYVVDEAIKEQSPEHFKDLENLKEVFTSE